MAQANFHHQLWAGSLESSHRIGLAWRTWSFKLDALNNWIDDQGELFVSFKKFFIFIFLSGSHSRSSFSFIKQSRSMNVLGVFYFCFVFLDFLILRFEFGSLSTLNSELECRFKLSGDSRCCLSKDKYLFYSKSLRPHYCKCDVHGTKSLMRNFY